MSFAPINDNYFRNHLAYMQQEEKDEIGVDSLLVTDYMGCDLNVAISTVYSIEFQGKKRYFDELDATDFLEYLKCYVGGDAFDVMTVAGKTVAQLENEMQSKYFKADDPLDFLEFLGAEEVEING